MMKRKRIRKRFRKNIDTPQEEGLGAYCPTCGTRMNRFIHSKEWFPRKEQKYYFKTWDKCPKCHRIQLYESEKVYLEICHETIQEGLDAEYVAMMNDFCNDA